MNVIPLKDRLIVKLIPRADRSFTGLYIHTMQPDTHETGVVLAVAPDEHRVKVGDRVIFSPGAGQDHTIDGENVVGLRRDQILGILQ